MNRLGFMVENQNLLKTYKDELEGVVIAYQQQYKAGKRSLFDLLNMENEYYLANKNFISAKFAIKNLKYQILFDIGELSSLFK